MDDKLKELIERIGNFDDSKHLVNALLSAANENYETPLDYYLKESATHIDGMWELLTDIRRHLQVND